MFSHIKNKSLRPTQSVRQSVALLCFPRTIAPKANDSGGSRERGRLRCSDRALPARSPAPRPSRQGVHSARNYAHHGAHAMFLGPVPASCGRDEAWGGAGRGGLEFPYTSYVQGPVPSFSSVPFFHGGIRILVAGAWALWSFRASFLQTRSVIFL